MGIAQAAFASSLRCANMKFIDLLVAIIKHFKATVCFIIV